MTDKKEQPLKEIKTFTEKEVKEFLDKQKGELREKAIDTLMEKNADLKEDRLLAGQDEFYNVQKWEIMRTMANDMVKSGALPSTDNVHTVMVKMQAGREMGMKPMESIKAFYIVKGVLTIFGDAVVRRLREHGWRVSYVEKQDECIATIEKKDEKYSEKFTFQDAEKSGWTKANGSLKAGWVDGINRRRKLRYGATSTLVKTYVPEVLGSAADIAEVAQDTVPLYNKNDVVEPDMSDPATEQQIDMVKQLIGANELDPEKAQAEIAEIDTLNLTQKEAAEKIAGLTKKK